MHIITRKRLNDFTADFRIRTTRWQIGIVKMKQSNFASIAEIRSVFPTAEKVGKLTVFNISGNNVRLIAAIHYNRKKVYIRAVLTHNEYDAGKWRE